VLAEDVAAAIVSSSTDRHPEHVLACVERGLPVLCEKPIALTLRETREVLDRVAAAGGTLQVSFQRRFDPGFAAARAALAEGQLGTLYLIRLNSHDHEPSPEHYIPTSGGMFRDLHVHDFDLARWLSGEEVDSVYALGALRTCWDYFRRDGDVDTTAIVLRMESGLPVLIGGGRHDPLGHEVRAEVYGSEDTIAVGLDGRTPLRSLEDGMPPPPERPYAGFLDRFAPAFRAETAAFVDVVLGRRDNPMPPGAAVAATRVAVACERSYAANRAVAVAEVEA
jgi:myo-inositol 2-dehydrogenase / D-chiro-inositol 1-dehydrogenase